MLSPMQVFIFRSWKDAEVVAFTGDREGEALPPDLAPWKLAGGNAIQVGDSLAGVTGGANAVLDGIGVDGYFLVRTLVYVTSQTLPPDR
jgi:hypothetical protein